MGDISLSINGKRVTAATGASLLEVADANNITIPRLCYHPQLKPYGACRLCLVEDEGSGRLMAACVTPAATDMAIQTDSERVLIHRRQIVRLMMAEHPESCVVCNKGNRCELRLIAARLGIAEIGLDAMPNFKPFEQTNPFMTRDLSKCVLCGKCIRADHELVGVGAIDYSGRGFASRPATLLEKPLEASICTFCGTCAAMCPTGALGSRLGAFVGTPEYEKPSVCGFCAVGCQLLLGVAGEQVVEVNPANLPGSVNGATLCIRGHYAHDFLHIPARLTQPMARREGQMQAADWETVLDMAANGLKDVRKEFGSQSIGFLASAKLSNEENYLLQKLARAGLGVHNIDHGSTPHGRSGVEALVQLTDHGWGRAPLAELEEAEAIMLLGADPGRTLPVMAYYLRRAAAKGIPLVVAHRRPTDLDAVAHTCLRLKLRPDVSAAYSAFLTALASQLYMRHKPAPDFIEAYTTGGADFAQALQALPQNLLENHTGISPATLKQLAGDLAGRKIAFVLGMDLLEAHDPHHTIQALINLSLLSGSMGQPGGGVYAEQHAANAWGVRDMGCLPQQLPGNMPLADAESRRYWEKTWNTALSPDQGLPLRRMLEQAEKGNLKALYIMGANPLRNLPDASRLRKALSNLELLIVQDILETSTTEVATIVLAGAAFSEKGGSFTNLEGRIQAFSAVTAPPGQARPDWWILAALCRRLIPQASVATLEDIQHEMRRSIPGYAPQKRKEEGGRSEEKKSTGLLTPDPSGLALPGARPARANRYRVFRPDASGEPMAFKLPQLPESQPATLSGDTLPEDTANSLQALIVQPRHHLGGGTRTSGSARMRQWETPQQRKEEEGRREEKNSVSLLTPHSSLLTLPETLPNPANCAILHPADAERLQLASGDRAALTSSVATIYRQVQLDARLTPGSVLLFAGSQNNDVMTLAPWSAEKARLEVAVVRA